MKKFLSILFVFTFLFGTNLSTSFAEDYDDEGVYEEVYDDDDVDDDDDDDDEIYDDDDDDEY